MTNQEILEVNWAHRHCTDRQYRDVSDRRVRVNGQYFSIRWLRYYAYCRHHVACMKVSSWFATMAAQSYTRDRAPEICDRETDLKVLELNARLMIREKRKQKKTNRRGQLKLTLA